MEVSLTEGFVDSALKTTVKVTTVLLSVSVVLFGCADSAQAKRNKFDACVINEMSGYWDVRKVWESSDAHCPEPTKAKSGETGLSDICWSRQVQVEKEVFVEPTQDEAEASCVYLLE